MYKCFIRMVGNSNLSVADVEKNNLSTQPVVLANLISGIAA